MSQPAPNLNSTAASMALFRQSPQSLKILSRMEERETWTVTNEDEVKRIYDSLMNTAGIVSKNPEMLSESSLSLITASTAYLKAGRGIHLVRAFCQQTSILPDLLWSASADINGNPEFSDTARIFIHRLRILYAFKVFSTIFSSTCIEKVRNYLQADA